MELDEDELKETKRRNKTYKKTINTEKLQKIITDRIVEINNEEWDIPNAKEIKFYCQEELEKILFKIKEE